MATVASQKRKKGHTQYKPGRHDCAYCRRDLRNETRLECAEASGFEFCVECFRAGVEVRGHGSRNTYRVIDGACTPILESHWDMEEELLLLEALILYGYGNWADVSSYIGTAKCAKECEAHYRRAYLDSPDFPLPRFPPPAHLADATTASAAAAAADAAAADEAQLASAPTAAPGQVSAYSATLSMYLPLRGEFDVEWNDESEALVAEMEACEKKKQQKQTRGRFRLQRIWRISQTRDSQRRDSQRRDSQTRDSQTRDSHTRFSHEILKHAILTRDSHTRFSNDPPLIVPHMSHSLSHLSYPSPYQAAHGTLCSLAPTTRKKIASTSWVCCVRTT